MAGFQPFPVPRAIHTYNYWVYVDKKTCFRNSIALAASSLLLTLIAHRYLLVRTVIMYSCVGS